MHKTPWTKGSSLPSDRLAPKNQPKKVQKSKQQTAEQTPKSKEVRELESLISNLESSTTPSRDPKGGCFCLGKSTMYPREHTLSPYTPICTSCGLILCTLNKPHHTCPNIQCTSPLLTPAQCTSLLSQLQTTLTETLAKEQAERERQIEDAKKAAGAFPSLPSSASSSNPTIATPAPLRPATEPSHKVLSLTSKSNNNKGGRSKVVVVSSYTTTPSSSLPASRTETPDTVRVPPPPSIVDHATNHRPNPSRPWQNLTLPDGDAVKYIPVPTLTDPDRSNSQSRTVRRKANQKARSGAGKNSNNRENSPAT